jgi:hypothetical protein
MVEFAMKNSVHSSLAHTPFFLNTGLNPITPIMLEVMRDGKVKCAQALQYTQARKAALESAMEYLKTARDRYKSYADANRKDIDFQVGDSVLLSTVNLNRHNQVRKLYPKFVGPFKVVGKVNDVAYKLDLPPSMPIHDVFHVNLLKHYIKGRTPTPPPIPIIVEGEYEYEVERILLHRDRKIGTSKKREYYVKWTGFGPEHCTWEPENHLRNAPEILNTYWEYHKLIQEAHARIARRLP